MKRLSNEDRIFWTIWIALTVMALLPVWIPRLLPLLDSPNHLALARGWHDYHDPAAHISDYFTLRVRPVPYVMFYGAIHLLMYVFSIETANKIFLSTYIVLFPISLLALARALGRSRWLCLGAFICVFNPGWIYGFESYLLATVLLFFGLAALLRYLDVGGAWRLTLVGVCVVACYFGHVLSWALFGLLSLPLLLLAYKNWQRVFPAATVLAATLPLALWSFLGEREDRTYINRPGFKAYWKDVPDSIFEFPTRALELFPGHLDMVCFGVLLGTTLGLLWWNRQKAQPPLPRLRLRWMLWVLALVYVSLPFTIDYPMSWWYVAPRLPALMLPLFLLTPAAELDGTRKWVLMPTVMCAILLPVHLTGLYRDFSQRNAAFITLVERLPRGQKTLVVSAGLVGAGAEQSGDPAASTPVYWHFLSWPMALRGGLSPYLFNQGIPLVPKKGTPYFNVNKTEKFDFQHYNNYQHYLIHQSDKAIVPDLSVKLIDELGEWLLYERIAERTDEP